jgi:hypothetical protein
MRYMNRTVAAKEIKNASWPFRIQTCPKTFEDAPFPRSSFDSNTRSRHLLRTNALPATATAPRSPSRPAPPAAAMPAPRSVARPPRAPCPRARPRPPSGPPGRAAPSARPAAAPRARPTAIAARSAPRRAVRGPRKRVLGLGGTVK